MQERRAHLLASSEWTNIPSEVVGLFARGTGTGVSCTQKVSLCDATICLVASDVFVDSLARRPTGGHQPLLTILCALDVILQKFSNGQHRHAAAIGKQTWLEPPYPKFLVMTLPRLRCCVGVRLASPAVSSVSLHRMWPNTAPLCQAFGNDCIECDFKDHPVTVLSGSPTHRWPRSWLRLPDMDERDAFRELYATTEGSATKIAGAATWRVS